MRPNQTPMRDLPTPDQLLENGFTLDVARIPDAPLNKGDVVLYADRRSGRVLIARAPIFVPASAAEPAA